MGYPRVHAQGHHDNGKSCGRPCCRKQLRASRRIGLKASSKEISKERRHGNLDMTSATTTAQESPEKPGMELQQDAWEDMREWKAHEGSHSKCGRGIVGILDWGPAACDDPTDSCSAVRARNNGEGRTICTYIPT